MRRPIIPTLVVLPASALIWWAVGYLPWMLAGRDVADELGDSSAATGLAVPLLTSSLTLLVLGGLVGGAGAALGGLLARGRRTLVLTYSLAGVLAALTVALWQSASALGDAAGAGYESDQRVVAALCATTVCATLLGWAFGAIASLGRAGLGVTLAGLAGALPLWLTSGVDGLTDATRVDSAVPTFSLWAGASLLAVALVTIGAGPRRRLVLWPVAVGLAWIVGPALSATGYLEALLRPPAAVADSLDAAWEVFGYAVRPSARALLPSWGAALVAAVLGAIALHLRPPTDPNPRPAQDGPDPAGFGADLRHSR